MSSSSPRRPSRTGSTGPNDGSRRCARTPPPAAPRWSRSARCGRRPDGWRSRPAARRPGRARPLQPSRAWQPPGQKAAGPPRRPGTWAIGLLRDRGGGVRGGDLENAPLSVEHLADLALAVAGDLQEAPGQLDRVLLRVRLQQREAGDQLLRLGERAVRYAQLAAREPHARAQRARQASLGREQNARALHLLDQPAHLVHVCLRRRYAGLGGLVDRQESHRRVSVWLWLAKDGITSDPFEAASRAAGPRSRAALARMPRLLAAGHLGAEALLPLPQLGGELGTEVLGLEHGAHLDLLALERGALQPLD